MKKFFAILSLAVSILAQSGTCPDGSGQQTVNGQSFCCPSGFINTNQNGTFCVQGCTVGFEPCFPFCTTDGSSNAQTTKGTCTSVPVTASNYSSLVGYTGNVVATATSSAQTTSATSSTSSSRGAAPIITAAPLLIAGALAGVVLA